jgi:hypothetical protein
MANRKIKGNTYVGVYIDTAPGANGYYTDPVSASEHDVGKLFISFGNIGSNTVTLQFKPAAESSWRTYKEFTDDDDPRQIIEDYTDCEYRIGIANGDYHSPINLSIDFLNNE